MRVPVYVLDRHIHLSKLDSEKLFGKWYIFWKEKNFTQEKLAEKLFITDRAVSKWERGLSLPDADKMLDLCNLLGINVNELLIGERVGMKDYNDKMNNLLVEMAKQEENKNKKIMFDMWILLITSFIFYIGIILLAAFTLGEGVSFGIIVCVSTIIFLFVAFYGLKMDIDAGYYECGRCHHKYIPKYFKVLVAPHIILNRYLRCPVCGKRSWSKKVMSKD